MAWLWNQAVWGIKNANRDFLLLTQSHISQITLRLCNLQSSTVPWVLLQPWFHPIMGQANKIVAIKLQLIIQDKLQHSKYITILDLPPSRSIYQQSKRCRGQALSRPTPTLASHLRPCTLRLQSAHITQWRKCSRTFRISPITTLLDLMTTSASSSSSLSRRHQVRPWDPPHNQTCTSRRLRSIRVPVSYNRPVVTMEEWQHHTALQAKRNSKCKIYWVRAYAHSQSHRSPSSNHRIPRAVSWKTWGSGPRSVSWWKPLCCQNRRKRVEIR